MLELETIDGAVRSQPIPNHDFYYSGAEGAKATVTGDHNTRGLRKTRPGWDDGQAGGLADMTGTRNPMRVPTRPPA